MKLLLTDSQQALGVALEHELEREPYNLLQPRAQQLDWHNAEVVDEYISAQRPAMVINNLGWGDSSASIDTELLVAAAQNISRVCARLNVPLIQLSSYRVFGDDNKSKHSEKDAPEPNSDAGRAFLMAENAVTEALPRALVLRTSWVIGSYGDNLLTRLMEALQQNKPWQLNARLRGAPTALSDLARVIVALVKQINSGADCWGIYHYTSGDGCSEVEFAEHLWEALKQQGYSGPEPDWQLEDYTPDDKPVSALLSGLRVRNDFGVQTRTWRTYLLPIVKQWLHREGEG